MHKLHDYVIESKHLPRYKGSNVDLSCFLLCVPEQTVEHTLETLHLELLCRVILCAGIASVVSNNVRSLAISRRMVCVIYGTGTTECYSVSRQVSLLRVPSFSNQVSLVISLLTRRLILLLTSSCKNAAIMQLIAVRANPLEDQSRGSGKMSSQYLNKWW